MSQLYFFTQVQDLMWKVIFEVCVLFHSSVSLEL